LGPALQPSQYLRNHLVEMANYYTFSLFSESQFMDEMKNGTIPFFSCGEMLSALLQWLFSPFSILG